MCNYKRLTQRFGVKSLSSGTLMRLKQVLELFCAREGMKANAPDVYLTLTHCWREDANCSAFTHRPTYEL